MRPIKRHVENDRRISHYIERIYAYTNRVSHRGPCRLALKKLEDLFPVALHNLKAINKPRSFSSKSVEKVEKPQDLIVPNPNIDFYNNRPDPYKPQLKEIKFKTAPGPTVHELHDSLAKATFESFKCNNIY